MNFVFCYVIYFNIAFILCFRDIRDSAIDHLAELLSRGALRSFSISAQNVMTLKIYYQPESKLKMVLDKLCKVNKGLAYSKLARYKEPQKRFRLRLDTPCDLDIKVLTEELLSLSGFAKITFKPCNVLYVTINKM